MILATVLTRLKSVLMDWTLAKVRYCKAQKAQSLTDLEGDTLNHGTSRIKDKFIYLLVVIRLVSSGVRPSCGNRDTYFFLLRVWKW
jgi:hypothetical protein